jgi:hypothetical protein
MGPFLAERISGGAGYWLCGVALAASAVSLLTLPTGPAVSAQHQSPVWKTKGCKQLKAQHDPRKVLSVGPMVEAGSYRDVMRDTVRAELVRTSPWRIELTETPSGGFYIDGTVDEMKVERVGDVSRVNCELKLWVRASDRPFSVLSGAATVDTTKGQRDIALSRQACVTTVAEELVERLLVGDPWE